MAEDGEPTRRLAPAWQGDRITDRCCDWPSSEAGTVHPPKGTAGWPLAYRTGIDVLRLARECRRSRTERRATISVFSWIPVQARLHWSGGWPVVRRIGSHTGRRSRFTPGSRFTGPGGARTVRWRDLRIRDHIRRPSRHRAVGQLAVRLLRRRHGRTPPRRAGPRCAQRRRRRLRRCRVHLRRHRGLRRVHRMFPGTSPLQWRPAHRRRHDRQARRSWLGTALRSPVPRHECRLGAIGGSARSRHDARRANVRAHGGRPRDVWRRPIVGA